MAVDNIGDAGKGTNEGDPGAGKGDDQTVDNKASATDKSKAADQQNDGQKKDGDKGTQLTDGVKVKGDTPPESKSQAPETYENFTLPEGFTMDQGALEAFSPVARGLGLSQENAQKIIDLYSKIQSSNSESIQQLFDEEHKKNVAKVKADPDIGGEKYAENIRLAGNVIGKFGSQGVLEAFSSTGIGDNPDVIRMFIKIGNAMGEDSLVDTKDGGGSGDSPKTLSDLLYDNMD